MINELAPQTPNTHSHVHPSVNGLAKSHAYCFQGKHGISITTDYVLDETLTLLRSRRSLSSASVFIDKIKNSKSVRVFWVEEGLFEKALDMFKQSDRKSWSFTDCTSFALMKDLLILGAFTFDSHFREAGLQILP